MNKIIVEKRKDGHKKAPAVSLPRLLDPVSAIDTIVTKALETSARKTGLANRMACIDCLKKCEATVFNYYCYNIAREMGKVLGLWSKNIKAVYACSYDDAVNEEDCYEKPANFPLIHMIILVRQKSKALDALMDAADNAITRRHRQMLGFKQLEHALDAHVIDDADVKNRSGYAALLASVYQPPIQVWQSNTDIQQR